MCLSDCLWLLNLTLCSLCCPWGLFFVAWTFLLFEIGFSVPDVLMDSPINPTKWSCHLNGNPQCHHAAMNLQIQQAIHPVDPLDIQMDNHWASKQAEGLVEGHSMSPLGSQPSMNNTQLTQPTSSTGNPKWRSHTWALWLLGGSRWCSLHLVLTCISFFFFFLM